MLMHWGQRKSKQLLTGSFSLEERRDGSYHMFAETPSGRRVWVVWRYDREEEELPDPLEESGQPLIFVITAY
jgi:hypothetical protein